MPRSRAAAGLAARLLSHRESLVDDMLRQPGWRARRKGDQVPEQGIGQRGEGQRETGRQETGGVDGEGGRGDGQSKAKQGGCAGCKRLTALSKLGRNEHTERERETDRQSLGLQRRWIRKRRRDEMRPYDTIRRRRARYRRQALPSHREQADRLSAVAESLDYSRPSLFSRRRRAHTKSIIIIIIIIWRWPK